MHPLLNTDIEKISIADRMQLVEMLWDSILANPERLPVTDEQKQALDVRFAKHQLHPEEGSSWEDVKKRLSDL
ncbi:MAG: addiction module protein [Cyanobacteria bacterium J06554_11]